MRCALAALCVTLCAAAASSGGLRRVPAIQLDAPLSVTAPAVDEALRVFGFFYICNHGVPEELLSSQFDQSRRLFALPAPVKRNLTFNPHLDIGYLADQALDEDSGALDQKEGFMLTNNGVIDPAFQPNDDDPLEGADLHWPPADHLPQYEAVVRSYVRHLMGLTHKLNSLLFAALGFGDDERSQLAARPFAVLKQMRYAAGGGNKGLGAGAHADWGSLTILATDGTPGLQVELNGSWLPVPPRDGCLIVNAGDQVRHWTNGEYRSANHRVVNSSPKPRYSTAFFTYFDMHARVSPLPAFVSQDRPAIAPARTSLEYFHYKLFESTGNLGLLEESASLPGSPSGDLATAACGAGGEAAADDVAWAVRPLANQAGIGVEVTGLDLRSAAADAIDAIVEAMHGERGVLVVRQQSLQPIDLEEVLAKFAPHFGPPLRYARWPGQSQGFSCCPHLSTLGNYRARERGQFGIDCEAGDVIGEFKPASDDIDEWHTDDSFHAQPKVAVALYAPDVPDALPEIGGETRFASCTAFWESLSAREQSELASLEAVHSWEVFMRFLEARDPGREKVTEIDCARHPDVTFPLVRQHPRTGKRAVFINPKNTRRVSRRHGEQGLNWTEEESASFVRGLAGRLVAHGTYRHAWRRGDLVLWDNRVLLHAASPFDASRHERLLFRAEFAGEPVVAPNGREVHETSTH